MKRYQNFNKYFNTNPRFWIITLGILAELSVLFFLSMLTENILTETNNLSLPLTMPILTGIVLVVTLGIAGIAVICFCIYLWINQVTLIHAYIGNSLKRRRYDALQCLNEIESELTSPRFAQIHSGLNKSLDFIITQNWIIGSRDVIFMNADAVRISDIISVDLDELNTYSFSQTTNSVNKTRYVRIKITDKNNRTFCFNVLNKNCQKEAYDYINKNIMADTGNDMP